MHTISLPSEVKNGGISSFQIFYHPPVATTSLLHLTYMSLSHVEHTSLIRTCIHEQGYNMYLQIYHTHTEITSHISSNNQRVHQKGTTFVTILGYVSKT
jgi:hypothetical protein